MSIEKSQAILKCYLKSSVWFTLNHILWHFSARLPVKVFKTLNGRQSHILSKFHKSKKFSRSELSWSISWSWSNQPVLWDFYIMFLLTRVQSMTWQATFDVITSWPFMRPPRKTGGKSFYAFWFPSGAELVSSWRPQDNVEVYFSSRRELTRRDFDQDHDLW